MNEDEKILVVHRAYLGRVDGTLFQGIRTDRMDDYMEAFTENGYFKRRGDAETDFSHKQLIPYVIFQRNDEVLVYERHKSGGEERLHSLLSMGVGGHMNSYNIIEELLRELNEEVSILSPSPDRCNITYVDPIGVLNDDSSDVGKVHFGALYKVYMQPGDEVVTNEAAIHNPRFVKISSLSEIHSQLESWSKLCANLLSLEYGPSKTT